MSEKEEGREHQRRELPRDILMNVGKVKESGLYRTGKLCVRVRMEGSIKVSVVIKISYLSKQLMKKR